jgi:colicin import membrane protein
MRPAEYTQEEIVAAGHTLRDAGRNVTGFALRQRVGGGTPNRLKQVWDEFLASQSTARAQPLKSPRRWPPSPGR